MGRGVILHIAIHITALICTVTQLYSSATAADSSCSCSSPALECHGVTPVLQHQLLDQLGSCTATSLQLKQQLLRQQHHTPVVVDLSDSSSMWQLMVCAALLVLCLLSTARAVASSRKCAALQQALQQQCNMSRAIYSSRQQLQKQLYQHQQRNAAWAASLQHMQWLMFERATALAAQEALLSQALGVFSMLEGTSDTSPAADQLTPAADADELVTASRTEEAEQQTADSQLCEAEGSLNSTAAAAAAASGDDSASKDDVSVIQQGLDTLHAYLHACSKAKLAGLEQLQLFVQQLEQDVRHSMQEIQQQQEEQQQQQLAGLLPDETMLGDDGLHADERQQQQLHAAKAAATGSLQESAEARLRDSPYVQERLAASAKQQAPAPTDPRPANDDVVRKLYFSDAAVNTGSDGAVAAAAAAAGDGGSEGIGDGEAAVLAEPVLGRRSAGKAQGLLVRLLLGCFRPSYTRDKG